MAARFVTQHRKLLIGAAILLAALGAFVLWWFQPQKLAIDQRVTEAAPTASATPADDVLQGMFKPLAHAASGTAKVVTSGQERFLRFEDFEVENGPDLFVYLSAADPSGPPRELGEDFVDLGRLKGNIGDQNYTIPSGTDLDRYSTAVVWCRRFTVAFAAAELA